MFDEEARPNIDQAQNFADNLKRVGSVSPPVLRIERIIAGVAHDQRGIRANHFFPNGMDAARVRFGSYDYNAVNSGVARGLRNYVHFVLRIHNFGFEHACFFNRDVKTKKHALVVKSFAEVVDANFLHFFGHVRGVRDPNLLRVSGAINFRSFAGALRHSSTEYDGHGRRLEWIFNHEPCSDAEKNPGACARQHKQKSNYD
jgi:hypothetical protein